MHDYIKQQFIVSVIKKQSKSEIKKIVEIWLTKLELK